MDDLPDVDYKIVETPDVKVAKLPVVHKAPDIEELDDEEPVELELVPMEELHPHTDSDATDEEIRRMLAAGNTPEVVAVELDTTLARVQLVRDMRQIHTTLVTQSGNGAIGSTFMLSGQDAPVDVANPRQVFMRSLVDFQECLQIAMTEYKNNPDSETNHAAMNGFMKTIDGMYKSMEKLGDPAGQACEVVKRVIAPHMKAVGSLNIRVFKMILEEISPTLTNSFQRTQLEDGLKDALKKLQANTRDEYNRAVRTTAEIFNVNIDNMLMKPGPVSGDFQ